MSKKGKRLFRRSVSQFVDGCKLLSRDPEVYLLPRTSRRLDNKVQFVDVKLGASPSPDKPVKVLLVVGKTGSGKTSLINSMINFILGVRWDDKERFKLIDESRERQKKEKTASQTDAVTVYTINHHRSFTIDYTLVIIDTPGFADTEGFEADENTVGAIQRLFKYEGEGGIDHIDCVGFVAGAYYDRLDATQKYVFQRMLSLFGKDIEKSIVLLLTFKDLGDPLVLDVFRDANIPFVNYFMFNNSPVYLTVQDKKEKSTLAKTFWKESKENSKNFLEALQTMTARKLKLSVEVLHSRKQLAEAVENILQKVRDGLNKSELIKSEESAIKAHTRDLANNVTFDYHVKIYRAEKVPKNAGFHVTNCALCNFTCHDNCLIVDDSMKFNCVAIDDNDELCLKCPRKCIWSVHHNADYKWEYLTEEGRITSAEMIEKIGGSDAGAIQRRLNSLNRQYLKNQKGINDYIEEAQKYVNELKEIALKPDPLSEQEYIDILITNEKTNISSGWQQRVGHLQHIKEHMDYLKNKLN